MIGANVVSGMAVVGTTVTIVVAFAGSAVAAPVAVFSSPCVSSTTVNAVRATSIVAPAARIHGLNPERGDGIVAGPDAGADDG